MRRYHIAFIVLFPILFLSHALAQADEGTGPSDLMTFAQGVLPISVDTGGADLRVEMTAAIALIDGHPGGTVITQKWGAATDVVEITYALPALTRFDGFAVPNVLETPSPSQTFFARVEILGSDQSAEGPFVPLASGMLSTHGGPGEVSALEMVADVPEVQWVKLRLSDGVSIETENTFFEFSEIIGTGAQAAPALSDRFSGIWKGRGVNIELAQDGGVVTGCYDREHRLHGTVDGVVLRALGADAAGIPSQFILIAADDGALRGLRSTNGAPFKPYDGEPSANDAVCLAPEPPVLGCGAVVHGIGFDFDSDVIRPGSEELLAALHAGLSAAGAGAVQIVGHSSSEGADDYNRALSERRAASVVAALVALGLDPNGLTASGRGEDEPIASNDDEAGRSLNRRVEVVCAG